MGQHHAGPSPDTTANYYFRVRTSFTAQNGVVIPVPGCAFNPFFVHFAHPTAGAAPRHPGGAPQGRLVAAAREYARLAQIQFDGGVAPYFAVLQAQQQLFPAELTEVQVRSSLFASTVDVYKAMGGGWVVEAEGQTQ